MMAVLLPSLEGLSAADAQNPTPAVHPAAPNFSRVDIGQRNVELATCRGKVVVLNFWATWCAPCLSEIPHFVEWQRRYRSRGLRVIGIAMDDQAEPVRTDYTKYGLNYPVVMGDEKLGEMYGGVLGVPVTFLIDRKGRIRFKHQGAADSGIIVGEIRALLTEK